MSTCFLYYELPFSGVTPMPTAQQSAEDSANDTGEGNTKQTHQIHFLAKDDKADHQLQHRCRQTTQYGRENRSLSLRIPS